VLLGAPARPRTFERVARWADGWIPMGTPIFEPVVGEWMRGLRAACEEADRDPATCSVTCTLTAVPVARLAEAVEVAAGHGMDWVLVKIGDQGADEVLPKLDRIAAAIQLTPYPIFA
jgi:alkanesulfonate monooxygenase SsuD/methylene tetrahydromethanopterin reductase-like flavin-dependent oxidoreductase (luciferase family)